MTGMSRMGVIALAVFGVVGCGADLDLTEDAMTAMKERVVLFDALTRPDAALDRGDWADIVERWEVQAEAEAVLGSSTVSHDGEGWTSYGCRYVFRDARDDAQYRPNEDTRRLEAACGSQVILLGGSSDEEAWRVAWGDGTGPQGVISFAYAATHLNSTRLPLGDSRELRVRLEGTDDLHFDHRGCLYGQLTGTVDVHRTETRGPLGVHTDEGSTFMDVTVTFDGSSIEISFFQDETPLDVETLTSQCAAPE